MVVVETQIQKKIQIVDYKAMQCEIISTKDFLDVFKNKNPHWTFPHFWAFKSKLDVYIHETFEAYQHNESTYSRQFQWEDKANSQFIYWNDLKDSKKQDTLPFGRGNRSSSQPQTPIYD